MRGRGTDTTGVRRATRVASAGTGAGESAPARRGSVRAGTLGTASLLRDLDELIVEEIERGRPVRLDAGRERLERIIARASRLMLAGGDEGAALEVIKDARRRLAALEEVPGPDTVRAELSRFAELWPHYKADERKQSARLMFDEVKSISAPTGTHRPGGNR